MFVAIAGIYGAITADKKIFFVQALIIFISVSYLSKRIFNLFNISSKSLKISYIKSLIFLIIIALIWID